MLFTVLKILFVWIICSHLKPFKLMAGPRSPASPVTTQLISRRWITVSSFQQRSNQRLVVLPQTRSSSFHGVKAISRLDGHKLFKCHQIYGWAVLPQTRPSFFHGVEKHFFVWMLCSHLKPFKFMAGPRSPTSPVTAQLNSRRWRVFSSWCYADCQQRLNERLVVLPQTRSSFFYSVKAFSRLDGMKLFKNDQVNAWGLLPETRPSFFHGVEQLFSSGCYAAI